MSSRLVSANASLARESPLDRAPSRRRAPLRWAYAAAVLAHAGIATLVLRARAPERAPSRSAAASVAEVTEIPVEVEPEPPGPPAPASEPPPQPARVRLAKLPAAEAKSPEAAPVTAQAAAVLAQTPDDATLDFGDTIVHGAASTYAGGVTAAGGSSHVAVRDTTARAGGMPGGRDTDTSAVDRSRPASLAGAAQWDCPFPEEAEDEGIEGALVTLRVRVGHDGTLEEVEVVRDPGDGFGREARRCARDKRWQPALDKSGRPVAAVSLVNVRFSR